MKKLTESHVQITGHREVYHLMFYLAKESTIPLIVHFDQTTDMNFQIVSAHIVYEKGGTEVENTTGRLFSKERIRGETRFKQSKLKL